MINESLVQAFLNLHVVDGEKIIEPKNGTNTPQVPNSTHDLPCRTPQTAGDMDNSDDTDTSSDIIIVVDSSNVSTDVSAYRTINLSRSSQSKSQSPSVLSVGSSCEETIPETESDTDTNDHGDLSAVPNHSCSDNTTTDESCIMENLVSTPIKRKHDCYLNSKDLKGRTCPLGVDLDASPVLTTTRSGRTVRAVVDHKFDYSSEPHDDDLDDSDDPDFEDHNDQHSDSKSFDHNTPREPLRKQRRISMRSSCCSSDGSSVLESDAIIYLDLTQPVAIIVNDPVDDEAVEFDSELKMRVEKFLGKIAPQRRLYNPMANFELEDNHMDEDEPPPILCNRLWTSNSNVQPVTVSPQKPLPIAAPRPIPSLGTTITNDMKILLIDDMVQRANANYFESQTPAHIKEPLDLSGLPSEEQRALNCQKHSSIVNMIEPYAGVYNFVDSLRSSTPLRMCHPLAVNFRKREFEACKGQLAKTLFNILNHTVFHCGLRSTIVWNLSMNTPSSIEFRIEAGGQRSCRISLWKNIKQPGVVVKELLHEMCHAAAFVFHGETGHGDHCRKWAYRAKSVMPELPAIGDCNGTYKYVCLLCRGRSFGRVKFEDEAPRLRCHYCQFEVNVEPCTDENVHNLSLTDQLVTPYKEFLRANYTKSEQRGHGAKMRELNMLYKEHTQQVSSN